MDIALYIFFAIIIILYIWYAIIIARKNKAEEALSGIEVQLRRRHDLIPNILKIAQKFMDHEKALIEEVTKLRAQAIDKQEADSAIDAKELFALEAQMKSMMDRLMISVEAYPDLKSDANMLEAQRAYQDTEDNIAASRRFYNAAINSLRNATMIFPGMLIAQMAGVKDLPFYEEPDQNIKNPIDAEDFLA
ncbi:MAG: LemA family protein [Micavibrio sp.]|nr:LemA family protein [Micavibrio sp.]|tara:strand:+ start:1690 stop:2262 length:573 start_codon:yes stop_codon:yes gene_type:complete